ncbi:PAS domain S-box protein [Haloglomus halophilum]|uniref:PAS domain S-box protein n=1 Tax=Haloglomus halophilum TaxID=2962672 RepID=UPI0020CA2469|nr:GAF domain-containing protein [Haloglomus halophilum]
MTDRAQADERYALLRWFAQVSAVGAGGLCTRCVRTDQFTAASVVEWGNEGRSEVASAGDRLPDDLLAATVSRAVEMGDVTVRHHGGVGVAAVPLPGLGRLALVLGTDRPGGFDTAARSFLRELGDAAAAVLSRDGQSPVPSGGPAAGDGAGTGASLPESATQGADTGTDDRHRKLRALQTTAESLLRAQSKSEIARVAVETARTVLDCPVTGIWLYDDETDRLEPAAVTDEGRELLGEPVSFERGESLAWKAFESGEIGQYDDVGEVEGAYNPSTPIRSELDVPIGRYGVLTTATTRVAEFTAVDLDLLRILASNTEAVLDRAAREHETERYREMVEAASDPIWAVDTAGTLTEVNQRFVDLSGYRRSALVGADTSLAFSGDLTQQVRDRMRALQDEAADSTTFQESFRIGGGEQREYRVNVSSLYEGAAFAGAVFVAHDVTELRRHEQLLSVFNRVLRHNLRNQLSIVLGNVDDLTEHDDGSVVTAATAASKAARNLLTLSEKTRRFGAVTDPDGVEVTGMDVTAEVRRAVAHAREQFPGATIETSLPEAAWARSHGLLGFAVEELVENAIEHNDRGPKVSVSVGDAPDDGTIEIRVADNGPGLPEMERRVIEEGLETPLMHASRLGLWMVRWTASTSGGETAIEENDPRGTVFVLRLPRADPPADD